MSRLLVTFVIGKLDWAQPLIPFMRGYASRTGADFLEVKWFPQQKEEYHGNPNWSCVQFLKDFVRQTRYEEVLMVDSDVLFLPSCPNLFDTPGDLVCSPDQAWRSKDQRYRDWLARNYPDSPELTAEGPYFNAGVLLFRRDAVAKLDLAGPYPNDYANDQDFLNMRVGEAELDVRWLDDKFNQRHVGHRQKALAENHILHFVGGAKSHIEPYTTFLQT